MEYGISSSEFLDFEQGQEGLRMLGDIFSYPKNKYILNNKIIRLTNISIIRSWQ